MIIKILSVISEIRYVELGARRDDRLGIADNASPNALLDVKIEQFHPALRISLDRLAPVLNAEYSRPLCP